MTLWYVVGGIFLAALVIVGFVAVNRRAALAPGGGAEAASRG